MLADGRRVELRHDLAGGVACYAKDLDARHGLLGRADQGSARGARRGPLAGAGPPYVPGHRLGRAGPARRRGAAGRRPAGAPATGGLDRRCGRARRGGARTHRGLPPGQGRRPHRDHPSLPARPGRGRRRPGEPRHRPGRSRRAGTAVARRRRVAVGGGCGPAQGTASGGAGRPGRGGAVAGPGRRGVRTHPPARNGRPGRRRRRGRRGVGRAGGVAQPARLSPAGGPGRAARGGRRRAP